MYQINVFKVKPFIISMLVILTVLLAGCAPTSRCVNFEAPLTVGTEYGTPVGQTPGTVILTANNIPVSIHNFDFTNGNGTFNLAKIDNTSIAFSSGQSIRTNNINLEFDFTQLVFTPSKVELDFLDLGGFENLAVNGEPVPLYAGELSGAPTSINGVAVAYTSTPVTGGKIGTLTLTGSVRTLKIGGQEFWIDSVCATE